MLEYSSNTIKVNLKSPYEIYLKTSLSQNIPSLIKLYTNEQKIIIIADNNLKENHLQEFIKSLKKQGFKALVLFVKATEKNKSMKTVNYLCNKILKLSINKNTPIIGFGGGIVGDIAGFCACILYRGLPFFQIPSTLLAMVDSSVGGKCGVNTKYGKNTIGAFYQPNAVFIDASLLDTLSERDYKSGYAECLKYALLFSEDYFDYLLNHESLFLAKNHDYLTNIIKNSCGFKAKVVEEDELETKDIRYLLNLGHTFAHALETYNNYKSNLTHGEAVSIGILLAFKLSSFLNLCEYKNYDKIKSHIENIGLPSDIKQVIKKVKSVDLINLMQGDKKNANNLLTLILAERIGKCFVNRNVNIETLKEFFKEVL
jgi:shikimate kinase/3-dehydroquinate synthase